MNRTIFKLAIFALVAVIGLSSCLGDSDSKAEIGESIAYIKSTDGSLGMPHALTSANYAISSSEIRQLNVGSFYKIGFTVNSKDGIYENTDEYTVYNATNVNIVDGRLDGEFPLGRFSDAKPANLANEIPLETFALSFYSGNKVLDNKFVFNYSCRSTKDDEVVLVAYYDEAEQKDKDGVEIDKKKFVIVDLRAEKIFPGNSETEGKHGGMSVINLGRLKSIMKAKQDAPTSETEQQVVYMQLRYNVLKADGTVEVLTLGELKENTNPNSNNTIGWLLD